MKHVRRILAFALTLVMALAIVPTALAQTVNANMTGGAGSITINNAAKGETYAVYQLFDATYDNSDPNNKKIAYSGEVPESLKDYFAVDDAGNVTAKVTDLNATAQQALKDWAATQTAVISAESDGSTLVFTNLKYGYYVVTTTQGQQAISVDSVNPDVTINDKNTYTITAEKTVNGTSYSIGETITYTATFGTANYVGEGDNAKIVTEYKIKDTLPEFLEDVTVTGITVGGSPITIQQFDDAKTITIDWATGDNTNGYKSIYNNGAQIVITYTAKLTDVANINTVNTNTVSIHPTVWNPTTEREEEPWDENWQDDAEIKTYAAALKKTDGTNPLAGAQFTIKGLTVTGSNGVYTVESYDPSANAADSAVLDTNSDGKLYIIGLKEGVTLTVTEFKAPNGYNKLTEPVTLTPQVMTTKIYKESGTIHYDAKGNVVSQESKAETHETVTANLTDLDANAAVVVNNQGTELPSTGGIGTTIFYIVGGVMVAGAVIFLLTKRRVNAE